MMKNLKSYLTAILFLSSSIGIAAPSQGRYFDRVIFVIFENTNYQDALRQPFFKSLADTGVQFTNFTAETHPSQGNYVALTSGSLNGVHGDGKIDLDVQNIADLLDAKGVTWKVYAEDYPGGCFIGTSSGNYARKHNPFISYMNIQRDARRCANIVGAEEFARDAQSGTLPQYVLFIPNEKNDGHDTGVQFADQWYRQAFTGYLSDSKFMAGTLIVSTFDENAGARGNQIYTTFSGPLIKAQSVVADSLTHYSLLKMVEDNWSLGSLGKEDDRAAAIPAIWK